MPHIRLSDEEQDLVLAALRPLTSDQRDAFLQDLVEIIKDIELGPGLLHRILAELQHHHFRPPEKTYAPEPRRLARAP